MHRAGIDVIERSTGGQRLLLDLSLSQRRRHAKRGQKARGFGSGLGKNQRGLNGGRLQAADFHSQKETLSSDGL